MILFEEQTNKTLEKIIEIINDQDTNTEISKKGRVGNSFIYKGITYDIRNNVARAIRGYLCEVPSIS